MKRFDILLLCLAILFPTLVSCGDGNRTQPPADVPDAHTLVLSGQEATLDGEAVPQFDYTWHCDPSAVHTDVKDAPAEYYTGTAPETDAAVYIDSELYYYPRLEEDGFRLVNYDGENEWAYYYTDGENDGYIFATLPSLGTALPAQMMHTEAQAAENRVLHITKAGAYSVTGEWKGQIKIDLGEEAFADPEEKVTLILSGVNVNCSVAPGVIFENAYECDNTWEDRETYSDDVDLTDAGVVVVIADGTDNTVTGTNVFRMLKTKYKSDGETDGIRTQKKMRKTDGAFYSYVSMRIEGGSKETGTLTVNAGFEGVDSELHLSFAGGSVVINSQDDGINVNEDHVSVVRFDGASVTVSAANGAEGDGVDSNGFIVLSGGTVSVSGVRVPDSALDSEDGIRYSGGTVLVDGKQIELTPGTVTREIGGMNEGRPEGDPGAFGGDFDLEAFREKVAALPDDATLADVLALLGMGNDPSARPQRGPGGDGGFRPDGTPGEDEPPRMPNGEEPPEPRS